jgi:hypothetical protein
MIGNTGERGRPRLEAAHAKTIVRAVARSGRILKGVKLSDLPVQQSTKVELILKSVLVLTGAGLACFETSRRAR